MMNQCDPGKQNHEVPLTDSYALCCDSCSASPKLTECLQKKKEVIDQMEVKLDTGIDRLVFYISLHLSILMHF